MNRGLSKALLLVLSLGCMPFASLSAQALDADIRFEAQVPETLWVGQEVELALDLFSNGFSFSGQLFQLPEVTGAYLLQADSSTVKLSDTRDGEVWQGLRYSILAYPQRDGVIEIPSFEVEFSVSAGFGSEPASFQFDTPVLRLQVELPPGADPSGLIVSSTDYSMNYQWNPAGQGGGPVSLKTGDAITLKVERRADSVPGMVFSPLPDFQVSGLEAYHDAPAINDRVNRGALTGNRTDSITFICEQEGAFEIPAFSFQWWDPEREVMSEKTVPGLSLVVEANPAFANAETGTVQTAGRFSWLNALLILLGLLVVSGLVWKLGPVARSWWVGRRKLMETTEPWAFKQVQLSCKSGDARNADRAIIVWLARFQAVPNSGKAMTLMELAGKTGQETFIAEVRSLQSAIVAAESGAWRGDALAVYLQKWRDQQLKEVKRDDRLPPLNPAS